MDSGKCTSRNGASSSNMAHTRFLNRVYTKSLFEEEERFTEHATIKDVNIDLREVYFLIMHFLSSGPCRKTFGIFCDELLEHELLPRRYNAWYSRKGVLSGDDDNDISFLLNYDDLMLRYPHVEKDHLVKLLKQLLLNTGPPMQCGGGDAPGAADVPTLLGSGPFSLLTCERNRVKKQAQSLPSYLRWPHMPANQVHGLTLREIAGGFPKHHRAPSIRLASYAVAKPSTMVQKMQNIKKLRGHRDAVYCAIFDRSGRYVITGSDDRLVKVWSMETGLCLASCRGHEGDITDLAVSSNNALVASASNDYSIRVWRLPDGLPISVLRGHAGAVTAIADYSNYSFPLSSQNHCFILIISHKWRRSGCSHVTVRYFPADHRRQLCYFMFPHVVILPVTLPSPGLKCQFRQPHKLPRSQKIIALWVFRTLLTCQK